MTRVKAEDILKPGAVLEVKEIDFNDPEVKRIFAAHHEEIRKLKLIRGWRYEGWWRKL